MRDTEINETNPLSNGLQISGFGGGWGRDAKSLELPILELIIV